MSRSSPAAFPNVGAGAGISAGPDYMWKTTFDNIASGAGTGKAGVCESARTDDHRQLLKAGGLRGTTKVTWTRTPTRTGHRLTDYKAMAEDTYLRLYYTSHNQLYVPQTTSTSEMSWVVSAFGCDWDLLGVFLCCWQPVLISGGQKHLTPGWEKLTRSILGSFAFCEFWGLGWYRS